MSFVRIKEKEGVSVLVSTDWVQEAISSPNVRIVACHNDLFAYTTGHLEGSLGLDCVVEFGHPVVRDVIAMEDFECWASRSGIGQDTLVVLYGEDDPRWACYAFWVLQLFGHRKAVVMDGGKSKWTAEGRKLTTATTMVCPTTYTALRRDDRGIRAFREDVMLHVVDKGLLVDARAPWEFAGEDEQDGRALDARGGRIRGAVNLPWTSFVADDGCLKSADEVREVVSSRLPQVSNDDVITYCRLGERSSVAWFVLKHVLNWPSVRNYDGGWAEWGNAIGLPVDR